MSGCGTSLGRYHFLAWTRRGIEASLNNQDNNGTLDARASLGVQVTITANGAKAATQPSVVNVQLYGPGDVIGIDCELCSSDGGPRVDRTFVYSGPAAVGSPSAAWAALT